MTDVLSILEHRRGELREVSFEVVSAGGSLAATLGGDHLVAVIGGDVEAHADRLDREGVDRVIAVPDGAEFNHDVYVQTVGALIEEFDPSVVIAPHTVNALDYVPAVAETHHLPLVPDVIDLEVEEGSLEVRRPLYGSKVQASVTASLPAVVTIRPGEWPAADGVEAIEVISREITPDQAGIGSTVEGYEEAGTGAVDVTAADFLIGVGRGIGEEANLELIEDLAAATGATIAASRPLIDRGSYDTSRQVGQSGKTVAPDVYLAVGISGAVQHLAGIKGAGTIIAVNTDPHAPIFDIADLGIVGDLFEVLPPLIERFQ